LLNSNNNGLAVSSRDMTVSIAGLDGAGKTSIVNKLLQEEITETYSTYGINQEIVKINGLTLGLTDLGGKEPFRNSLWQSYLSRSDALIYVVDGTKEEKFDESQEWFVRALKWIKQNSPVLVLINTWDKPVDESVIKSVNDIFTTPSNGHLIEYLPISPITGKNINKTVDWLANAIITNLIEAGITVDYFVAYIKTETGLVEASIKTADEQIVDESSFPVIRYKFAPKNESILEYMRIGGRQVVMAADNKISCWLITTRTDEFKGSSLLMKLLTEFIKEIQGLRVKKDELSESDLTSYLVKYIIDNQTFWSEKQLPMFEISTLDTDEIF